jgi:Family of unknown function (DUF6134)
MRNACLASILAICVQAQADSPAPAASPSALPWPAESKFRILDGDKAVGTSLIQISGDRSSFVVKTTTHVSIERFLIKALIDEQVDEHWVRDRLESLSSDMQTNGVFGASHKTLSVSRTPEGALVAKTGDGSHTLPADAVPLTFWGAPVLHDGAFFDISDGQLLSVQTAPGGTGVASVTYQGRKCIAKQVSVDGPQKTQFVIWLDFDGSLCGLRQHVALDDMTYERQAPALSP